MDNGRYLINTREGRYGFIDGAGTQVIAPRYDRVSEFFEGAALVAQGPRQFFIDRTGAELFSVPQALTFVGGFSHGVAFAYECTCEEDTGRTPPAPWPNRAWFAYTHAGQCTRLRDASVITMFRNGFASVRRVNGWGCINTSLTEVIPCRFDCGVHFSHGLAAVQEEGRVFFITPDGTPAFTSALTRAFGFSEGTATVQFSDEGNAWGTIDTHGSKTLVLPWANDLRSFHEGLAAVRTEDRWGFIDREGNVVSQPRYTSVGPFSCGLAQVTHRDGRKGYVTPGGTEVISLEADARTSPFIGGTARIHFNPPGPLDSGYINRCGEWIWLSEWPTGKGGAC